MPTYWQEYTLTRGAAEGCSPDQGRCGLGASANLDVFWALRVKLTWCVYDCVHVPTHTMRPELSTWEKVSPEDRSKVYSGSVCVCVWGVMFL